MQMERPLVRGVSFSKPVANAVDREEKQTFRRNKCLSCGGSTLALRRHRLNGIAKRVAKHFEGDIVLGMSVLR